MTRFMMAAASSIALLAACSPQGADESETDAPMNDEAMPADEADSMSAPGQGGEMSQEDGDAIASLLAGAQLVDILAHERREGDRARDEFRHPMDTIAFFGLEPDMTIAEALPGGGWYTRILLPYVAGDGRYVALNYQEDVWAQMYGENWNEESQAEVRNWPETAPAALAENGPVSADAISAYMLDAIPASEDGQGDAVLFIRALHHLNRFGSEHMDVALGEVHDFLKPGGMVGVVQHRAPADETDERASGDRGYMREADVIAAFERNGFELAESSDINANPADTADYERGVWMLPPSNGGDSEGEDVPPLQSVGESDRMTLRFVKPD